MKVRLRETTYFVIYFFTPLFTKYAIQHMVMIQAHKYAYDFILRLTLSADSFASLTRAVPPPEEILSSNSALWFGPNGLRLAFATFNDSRVDTMNFPLYGRPGDLSFQYPIQQSIKYPKVRESLRFFGTDCVLMKCQPARKFDGRMVGVVGRLFADQELELYIGKRTDESTRRR